MVAFGSLSLLFVLFYIFYIFFFRFIFDSNDSLFENNNNLINEEGESKAQAIEEVK